MSPRNFALGEANEYILARGYVSPIQASCELQLVPKAEVGPEGCGVGWRATEQARGSPGARERQSPDLGTLEVQQVV